MVNCMNCFLRGNLFGESDGLGGGGGILPYTSNVLSIGWGGVGLR